jgi:D-psicose/D-tagatose/L-ribulose 3-epimerase
MAIFGIHLFTYAKRIDNDTIDILPHIREIGFDGCEVPLIPEQLDALDTSRLRARLGELDMRCATSTGITSDMSTISEDEETRGRGVAHLKRCIDVTARLGSDLMAGALYAPFDTHPRAPRTPAQWERSAAVLREVASYAAEKGVTLCIEPLNRYEHFFINTVADAVSMVRDIGESNVRINVDTYHMNIEEKHLYDAMLAGGDLIGHVHCSENDRGIPGTGHVEWDGLFRGLAEIGYDGWLIIESFFEPIPAIAEFTPIWRKLAPGADELARRGLAFIRDKAAKPGRTS